MLAPARDQLSEVKPLSDPYAEGEIASGDLCGTAQLLVMLTEQSL